MNKENLQRMADYIRTIPQELFDMSNYRCTNIEEGGNISEPICNSVGCVLGHCTVLDAGNIRQILKTDLVLSYEAWAEQFTGMARQRDNPATWLYCFGSAWAYEDNTPEGAANRIEYVIKHGEAPPEYDYLLQ